MSLLRTSRAVVLLLLFPALVAAEEWFDAYGRGLEALRKQQGVKAAQHFQRAIGLRPEPGANLITYGTNRLATYHPYLNMARAHLLAGDAEKAAEALRRSEARGKEPPGERAQLAAMVEEALRATRAVATSLPAAPQAPAPPPATVVAMTQPTPGTLSTPAASPSVQTEEPTTRRPERRIKAPEGLVTPAPAATPASTMPPAASLVVYSQPGGAMVYLDDEPLGVTDPGSGRLVKSDVAPGAHRLRVTRASHGDVVRDVQVGETGPITVTVNLPVAARPALPGAALGALAALGLLAAALFLWKRRRAAPPAVGPREPVTLPRRRQTTDGSPGRETASGVVALLDEPWGEGETRAIPTPTKVSAENQRFGEYRLIEQLGRGGMAAVFRAERGGEVCALKRPLAAFSDDPEFLQRFLREAEIGRTLHHPNIIRIFERGEADGIPFFTMEVVNGETLQSFLRRNGAMAPRVAARVVAQVAEALDYAHLKGVVHRDLKPSNIMMLEDGTVKVMDYGIARSRRFEGLTVTGAFLGTPDYVAPETAEGKGTDARSDLYALGVVFYEILTGSKPFVADTPFATMKKHCTEPPTPPSAISPGIPGELEEIILRLLRKDPDERYASAEELLIELRGFLNRAA